MKAVLSIILLLFTGLCSSFELPPPDNFIIGGEEGNIANFPYQASLRVDGRHTCGASIIGPQWALTAAHCLLNHEASDISLRVGSTTFTSGGEVLQASAIFSHPDFNPSNGDYDVALINISEDFSGENVETIALPAVGSRVPTGAEATISGWGLTSTSSSMNPIDIQFVTVTILSHEECEQDYSAFGGVDDVFFCAGQNGHDSCQGDSGGPIVANNVQVGIVSGGVGCANPRYPGLYTSTSYPAVRNWITQVAGI